MQYSTAMTTAATPADPPVATAAVVDVDNVVVVTSYANGGRNVATAIGQASVLLVVRCVPFVPKLATRYAILAPR